MNIPQTPLELLASQLDWAHKNIANNLDFLPADKMDWKPAPTSKSVAEILTHATGTVHSITAAMQNRTPADLPPVTNSETAKHLLAQVVNEHKAVLSSLTPAQLEQKVTLPFGDFPMGIVAGLPVVELINHHGQITYIETLLGDNESHLVFG